MVNDHALNLRLPAALYQELRERVEIEERRVASLIFVATRAYLSLSSSTFQDT